MNRFLPILILFLLLFLPTVSFAQGSLVISQIQLQGDVNVDDEFVELFNPTNSAISVDGWKLKRKTQGGAENTLVASLSGVLAPRTYFLITHPEYNGTTTSDFEYSSTSSGMLAINNTVLLYNHENAVIDKVGMGLAGDFEGTAAPNASPEGSIERLLDTSNGHGVDTDNNLMDFVSQVLSSPRNSSFVIETPTPTPTQTPTATPISTPSATPTPAVSPTPSETATPTASPTAAPSSTPTMSPTPAPSVTPSPTGTPLPWFPIATFNFPMHKVECQFTPKVITHFWTIMVFPKIVCTTVTL